VRSILKEIVVSLILWPDITTGSVTDQATNLLDKNGAIRYYYVLLRIEVMHDATSKFPDPALFSRTV
jgi:hypothetical protein